MSGFVGEFSLPVDITQALASAQPGARQAGLLPPEKMPGLQLDDFLSLNDCSLLLAAVPDTTWVPVGYTGIQREYAPGDPVGSLRASCFSEALAQTLWQRLAPHLPEVMDFSVTQTAPADGHAQWKPVGLNPLMRFIRYDEAGLLVPHYDGPYVWSETRRSLMSLVIYLTDSPVDVGKTRFMWDTTEEYPPQRRCFDDWTRLCQPDDIREVVQARQGRAILFNHWLLHDAEPLPPGHQKIIIRTDVAFEKC